MWSTHFDYRQTNTQTMQSHTPRCKNNPLPYTQEYTRIGHTRIHKYIHTYIHKWLATRFRHPSTRESSNPVCRHLLRHSGIDFTQYPQRQIVVYTVTIICDIVLTDRLPNSLHVPNFPHIVWVNPWHMVWVNPWHMVFRHLPIV